MEPDKKRMRRVFISRHVTFDEATLYDPPSVKVTSWPRSQGEVPHMQPTVTDSASSAPDITILPILTASSSSPITAIEEYINLIDRIE